jgi:hypothetical protein
MQKKKDNFSFHCRAKVPSSVSSEVLFFRQTAMLNGEKVLIIYPSFPHIMNYSADLQRFAGDGLCEGSVHPSHATFPSGATFCGNSWSSRFAEMRWNGNSIATHVAVIVTAPALISHPSPLSLTLALCVTCCESVVYARCVRGEACEGCFSKKSGWSCFSSCILPAFLHFFSQSASSF